MTNAPFQSHCNPYVVDNYDVIVLLPQVCCLQVVTKYKMESLSVVIGDEVFQFERNQPQVICIYRTSALKCVVRGEPIQGASSIVITFTNPPIMMNCGWHNVAWSSEERSTCLTEAQYLDRNFSVQKTKVYK
jgi:hypothetical protein